MPRQLVPRTRANETWTEAKFWGFIRSNIRLMQRKWPPLRTVLERAKRPSQSDNKRLKWQYQCDAETGCGGWFPRKEVQVDHTIPCGSLKSEADIGPFVMRMLVEEDGLKVLCSECHQAKTNREREERKCQQQ